MKHNQLSEVIEVLKRKPKYMRKVKIFAMVGVFAIFIVTALVVWAGISTINHAASFVDHVVQSPSAQSQIEEWKLDVKNVSPSKVINCWDKAQSFFTIQPWLERSFADNIAYLRLACFKNQSNVCQEADCQQIHNRSKEVERILFGTDKI